MMEMKDLRGLYTELMEETEGLIEPQIKWMERTDEGKLSETEINRLYKEELKEWWIWVLENEEYKHHEMYKNFVELFGIPFEVGEEE